MSGAVKARLVPAITRWAVEPEQCPIQPGGEEGGAVGQRTLCVMHTDLYGTRKWRYYLSLRAGWDTTLPIVAAEQARSALSRADGRSVGCYTICSEAHDKHASPGC
jgi:hypothetical protein